MENDTLVILHADHGWHLGELGHWQKFVLWELGTRVPLMIKAPWIPQSHGKRSNAPVELVDVFPTMIDLSGSPQLPDKTPLDGLSLGPILKTPGSSVKSFA